MSRIGKKPVGLPEGVRAKVSGQTVSVAGPKGEQSFTAGNDVTIAMENGKIAVSPRGNSKYARQQWGMSRSMVANCVEGVTRGFRKELMISGVGYRAQLLGSDRLKLLLGYSHDVIIDIPDGITVTLPRNTHILIDGIDKQAVGQFAAKVRSRRKVEPYKGKGIRYAGEHVFRKDTKRK